MSGDAQPKKRKDKRRKKDESAEEVNHPPPSPSPQTTSQDEIIHVHKDIGLGGNICTKLIFFCLLSALGVMIGLIFVEFRGSSDEETISAVDSPWSVMLENWVESVPDAIHGESSNGKESHEEAEDDHHDDVGGKDKSNNKIGSKSFGWFNFWSDWYGGTEEKIEENDAEVEPTLAEDNSYGWLNFQSYFGYGDDENKEIENEEFQGSNEEEEGLGGEGEEDEEEGGLGGEGEEDEEEEEEESDEDIDADGNDDSSEEKDLSIENDIIEKEEEYKFEKVKVKRYRPSIGEEEGVDSEEMGEDEGNLSGEQMLSKEQNNEEEEDKNVSEELNDDAEEEGFYIKRERTEEQELEDNENEELDDMHKLVQFDDEDDVKEEQNVSEEQNEERETFLGRHNEEEIGMKQRLPLATRRKSKNQNIDDVSDEEMFPEAIEALKMEQEEDLKSEIKHTEAIKETSNDIEENEEAEEGEPNSEEETSGLGLKFGVGVALVVVAHVVLVKKWNSGGIRELPTKEINLREDENIPTAVPIHIIPTESLAEKRSVPLMKTAMPEPSKVFKIEGEEEIHNVYDEVKLKGTQDLRKEHVKENYDQLLAQFGQPTPESSDPEQSEDEIPEREYSDGGVEEESVGEEESGGEVDEEEISEGEEEPPKWINVNPHRATESDAEEEDEEEEEESEDEIPLPTARKSGGQKSYEEEYSNADITNEYDWGIRERLDQVDDDLENMGIYF